MGRGARGRRVRGVRGVERVRPRDRGPLQARDPGDRWQPQCARRVHRLPRQAARPRRPAAPDGHSRTQAAVKIATWNVNSLKVRLEHVLALIVREQPDVLALQETKTRDDQFPAEAFSALGYSSIFAGQAGYNGVAIVSRLAPDAVTFEIGGGYVDEQK